MPNKARITGISFSLAGDEDIVNGRKITTRDIYRGNEPAPDGIYSQKLGTTSNNYRCMTCGNDLNHCFGHFGYYELKYPIYNAHIHGLIHYWLRVICFNCGLLVRGDHNGDLATHSSEMQRMATAGKVYCENCGEEHPHIIQHNDNSVVPPGIRNHLYLAKYSDRKEIMYPHRMYQIFSQIPQSVVSQFGSYSHPRKYIIHNIPIPPVNIRPEISIMSGSKSSNNSITNLIYQMIKINDENMYSQVPDSNVENFIYNWHRLQMFYNGLTMRTSSSTRTSAPVEIGSQTQESIPMRITGKEGHIRRNLLGKPVYNVGRTTISCDPTLPADTVRIPFEFAKKLQLKEAVQDFNRERIMTYVNNAIAGTYPAATSITKISNGMNYRITDIQDTDTIALQDGDVVMRDVVDGDYMLINRQPSLLVTNIAANRIIVTRTDDYSMRINVLPCDFYNADFDGDDMNVLVTTSLSARSEIRNLSNINNFFVSYAKGAPAVGETNDSIVGMYNLTAGDKRFDRYETSLLLANVNTQQLFKLGKREYTGKEIVSMLLSFTPINYESQPQFYNKNYADVIDYEPNDIRIIIRSGQLQAGALDKKSLGGDKKGNILHKIAHHYDNEIAMGQMFNFQQLAIGANMRNGNTVGITDMRVDTETRQKLNRIVSDIINKSYDFTNKLNQGELVSPIGKTLTEYYEEQQFHLLTIGDDMKKTVMRDMGINNLNKLVMTGSKGKLEDVLSMVSAVGQNHINGERVEERFAHRRTSPHFRHFDPAPEAKGFNPYSYAEGVPSDIFYFSTMVARHSLIVKSLSTAVTGDQNRKAVKNLETLTISNLRETTNIGNYRLVQHIYGNDGYDPRFLINVDMRDLMLSRKQFRQKYYYNDKEYGTIYAHWLELKMFMYQMSRIEINQTGKTEYDLPVSTGEVVVDYQDGGGDQLDAKIDMVQAFVRDMPYIYTNNIYYERGYYIPDYLRRACSVMQYDVLTTLCAQGSLPRIGKTNLSLLLNFIKSRIIGALISPGTGIGIITTQAISEPMTQSTIDATHTGGGSSGIDRVVEVLRGKSTEQMSNPVSYIMPLSDDNYELAGNIKLMNLGRFVSECHIFFEEMRKPVHPDFKHEADYIGKFLNRGAAKVPSRLLNWCIRFQIDKTSLLLMNMSMELIVSKLREEYPNIFIIHTDENADSVWMRVYVREAQFTNQENVEPGSFIQFKNKLYDTVIRGVPGINETEVHNLLIPVMGDDYEVENDTNHEYIHAYGSNLPELFKIREIDPYNTHTNSVREVYDYLGIEAARQRLIIEMRNIIGESANRHFMTYADELTWPGHLSEIGIGGVKTRDPHNILLQLGYEGPKTVLQHATGHNDVANNVNNLTSSMLIGSVPQVGSHYNKLEINTEVVQQNVQRSDDYIRDL